MEQFLYKEMNHAERVHILAKTCHGRETMTFKRTLTPGDVADRKDLYTREQMRLATIENDFKEYKARKAADIKTIKSNQEEALEIIANESIEVFDEVFLIADHAEGLMLFVDKLGEIVHKRDLKPEERQGRLMLDDAAPIEKEQSEGNEFEEIEIIEETQGGTIEDVDPGDQVPVQKTKKTENKKRSGKGKKSASVADVAKDIVEETNAGQKGIYAPGAEADPEAMARVAEWDGK